MGAIITTAGIKKGMLILALIIFPILFPVMISFGVALFVIALFATSGTAVTTSAAVGRKLYGPGNPPSLLNQIKDPVVVVGTNNGNMSAADQCVRRVSCQILTAVANTATSHPSARSALQG